MRPATSAGGQGERINLSATISLHTAKENACFAVASLCTFGGIVDKSKSDRAWEVEKQRLQARGASQEAIESAKLDWPHVNGKRHVLENSFEFTVESVGVYTASRIVSLGLDKVVSRIDEVLVNLDETPINPASSTIPNAWDVTLTRGDHTLGNMLDQVFHMNSVGNGVDYCGFRRPHPHQPTGVLRLGFNKEVGVDEIRSVLRINLEATKKMVDSLRAT